MRLNLVPGLLAAAILLGHPAPSYAATQSAASKPADSPFIIHPSSFILSSDLPLCPANLQLQHHLLKRSRQIPYFYAVAIHYICTQLACHFIRCTAGVRFKSCMH